jgi:L-threonylcarbamoyladenylate synthase
MDIKSIVDQLKTGKTLLYPTDTIWGLGCDATNEAACQKIINLKRRSAEKSFIILVDSFQMVEKYIPNFPEVCYDLVDLAERPLTIIYPNAEKLAPSILSEDGSVGIRITKDLLCLKLIRGLRGPLVSTSANISNMPFPKNFSEIDPEIKSKVDLIAEERTNEQLTTPSQIIKIGVDGSVKVIRP